MAAPILPTSAAGLLAAHSLPIPAGGVLVAMKAGLFTPPRLLMVPAGTRLPRGVHAVAVVLPTQALQDPAAAVPCAGRWLLQRPPASPATTTRCVR